MKNFILILTVLFSCSAVSAQSEKLGWLPGLGSSNFHKVPDSCNFQFSDSVAVEFRWYGHDKYAVETHDTLWHSVKNVEMAYGDDFEEIDICAMKIHNRWVTMYGGEQVYEGEMDGKFFLLFCYTEQPCFLVGVPTAEKNQFLKEFKKLYAEVHCVGAERENYAKKE